MPMSIDWPRVWPMSDTWSLDQEAKRLGRAKTAIEYSPKNAGMLVELAASYHSLGHAEEAARAASEAITYGPDLADAHHVMGNVLWEAQRRREALVSLHRAVKLDEKHVNAHCALGNILLDDGNAAGALLSFERGLELDQNSASHLVGKGCALGILEKYKEAAKCLELAMKRDVYNQHVYRVFGNVLYMQGKMDAALDILGRAIYTRPDDAMAHYVRHKVLEEIGYRDKAREALQEAQELNPTVGRLYEGNVWLCW